MVDFDHDAIVVGSGFELGVQAGRSWCEEQGVGLNFRLTITVDDLDRFVVDPRHVGAATGWVECEALGGRLPVERGVFNLFVNEADPKEKRMLYQLWFRDGTGRPLTLVGHKVVQDHEGRDLWSDTTTLYTKVLEGHVGPGQAGAAPVVAAGVLRLGPFGRLFAGGLGDVYLRRVLPTSPL